MLGIDGAVSRCGKEIPWDKKKYMYNFKKFKFQKRLDFDIAQPHLHELANNQSEIDAIRLYASLALIEIGDRRGEILKILMDTFNNCGTLWIQDEPIRAFSYFNTPGVIEILINRAKSSSGLRSAAIDALAATGESSAREYLEFLASNRGEDKKYRKLAQKALSLFGESYDTLKSKFG